MDLVIKGILKKDEIESQEIYYVVNKKEVFKVETKDKLDIEIPKVIAKKGLIRDNTPIEISLSLEIHDFFIENEKKEEKKEKPMLLIPIKKENKEMLDKELLNKLRTFKEEKVNNSVINKKELNIGSNEDDKTESIEKESVLTSKKEHKKENKIQQKEINEEDLEKNINEFLEKIKKLKEKIKEELQHI